MNLLDFVLHIDRYLISWSQVLGGWSYILLFLVIFAETGLVITPFLPGDSLLFAVGALTQLDSGLSFTGLGFLLVAAAFVGDNVNYQVGKYAGPKIFRSENSRIFNRQHLIKTQKFYEKYGSQAVILARFMPIFRTFVPFVAGIGRMHFGCYLGYSLVGAIFWTQIFLWGGRLFGDLPAVKGNFHIVIFAVIGVSLIPVLIGWLQSRRNNTTS